MVGTSWAHGVHGVVALWQCVEGPVAFLVSHELDLAHLPLMATSVATASALWRHATGARDHNLNASGDWSW